MQQFATLHSPLGDKLRFSLLCADETVSEPFTFEVTALSSSADLDFNQLLGQHVTVSMALAPLVAQDPRHFDGLVERVALVGRQERDYCYQLVLRPWFWFLSQTWDCKVFQNKTVLDIVDEVLADHPIAALEVRCTASLRSRPYCVQYRESDFAFLSRLMEQEGIRYHFTHAQGKHTMVLSDDSAAHELCAGCADLPVRHADAGRASRGDECVFDLARSQCLQPGKMVLQDYDFTRPQVNLQRQASAAGEHALGDMEVFDYPGLYKKESDGEHYAHTRMEELVSPVQRLSGASDARALACGGLIKLHSSVRGSDDGEYLVLGTQIQVSQPAYEGGDAGLGPGYQCRFQALPSSLPYRSPRRTPKPVVRGPQTAVVVGPSGEEIFTDKFGRVKLQFHWDRYGQHDEKSSCWVRVSSPWAGKSFGFVQIPRIGQEVVVSFLEGDPDQPLITGRVYNADQMPPWELPANATQSGVLTRSSKGGAYGNANALRFEDKKGAEQLWLHAEKDQLAEVEHDEDKWVGNDRRKTIDGHETTVVHKNRTETVDQNETITVHQNRTETVDLNETITIAGHRTETVNSGETVTITGGRSHTVNGLQTTTISLAEVHTVGAGRMHNVGAAEAVTVGGAQMVNVGGAQMVTIGAIQKTNVGGAQSVSVAGIHKLSAAVIQQTSRGVFGIKAAGTCQVQAPTIVLKAGGSTITMNSSGITIKGAKITIQASGSASFKAGGSIKIKGANLGED